MTNKIIPLTDPQHILHMDESYIASRTKKDLALSGEVKAEVLNSGFSRALLYLVINKTEKYVVRFLKSKTENERLQEITALKIASQEHYGPHLYFVGPNHDYIIMEYLYSEPISKEKRHSTITLQAIGRILKKIHNGPQFMPSSHIINSVQNNIQILKKHKDNPFPFEKMEAITKHIESLLLPHIIITPTHGDLHPRNLIFCNNEFRAIDYETATQSDPYIDIATVAINYNLLQHHEEILLLEYFDRKPLQSELAKLYFMKLIVLINYASLLLKITPHDDWKKYKNIHPQIYDNFFKEIDWQAVDLKNSTSKLQCINSTIKKIVDSMGSKNMQEHAKSMQ